MARRQFQDVFPDVYFGSEAFDAASMLDGNEEAGELTVTGAALGDFVIASMSIDVADLELSAQVTAANTVTYSLSNNTGGTIDLGASTLRVTVLARNPAHV